MKAATLKERIRADLEAEILSGRLGPGARVPFEHELMARYRCSRMTVNAVMGALVDAGLIERRRRAGTFVRRPVAIAAVIRMGDAAREVDDQGKAYRYELLARIVRAATPADHARLGGDRATRILALVCRHFADDEPFAHEDRVLDLDTVPDAEAVDFAGEAPGQWLIGHAPWTEAEHRIGAIAARGDVATLLGLKAGTPALVIRRRTIREGRAITAVTLTYPGERHELVARFTP